MRGRARFALIGVLAGAALAGPALARCVRDVSESGYVSVRCSDGVRGRLAGDDAPAPGVAVPQRPSGAPRTARSGLSALPESPSQNLYRLQSGDATGRPNDSASGAYARSSGITTAPAGDRRP